MQLICTGKGQAVRIVRHQNLVHCGSKHSRSRRRHQWCSVYHGYAHHRPRDWWVWWQRPMSGSHEHHRSIYVYEGIDIFGFVLWAGAFISGIMAISFGGAKYGWRSGHIIGLLCCSGTLWLLFGVQQRRAVLTSETDRLFPINVCGALDMCILVCQTATTISILFITLNYLPTHLQFVGSDSALQAAIQMLLLVFTAAVSMLLTGTILERLGYYMPWYLIGSAIAVLGTALMLRVDTETSFTAIYGYTVLLSAGTCLYIQASYPVSQAKVGAAYRSNATTLIGCTQAGSIAISLAVSNSIFFNRVPSRMCCPTPPEIQYKQRLWVSVPRSWTT